MKVDGLIVLMCGLMIAVTASVLAETPPDNIKNGESLYQQHCLRCHGERLDGKGPDAASLNVHPTDFHTYLSPLKGRLELEVPIRQGRKVTPMHGWDTTLTDQQIYDLIAYIYSAVPPEVKP